MNTDPDTTQEEAKDQSFSLPVGTHLRARWAIAGGISLFVLAAVDFLLALRFKFSVIMLQLTCTAPTMAAIGLILSAWRDLRAPWMVQLSDERLAVIKRSRAVEHWPWDQIALVKTETLALHHRRVLSIFGVDGATLTRLPTEFDGFDQMAAAIERRIASNPSSLKTKVERKKLKRTATLMSVGGVLAMALAATNAWIAWSEMQSQRLMTERSQPMTATVTEKFIAPDGRTHRLKFRVDTPAAEAPELNVEVSDGFWMVFQVGSHVGVISVPGRPDIAKLQFGQIPDELGLPPMVMIAVSVAVAGFGLVLIVVGFVGLRGTEIRFNRDRGLHFYRPGSVAVRSSGAENVFRS